MDRKRQPLETAFPSSVASRLPDLTGLYNRLVEYEKYLDKKILSKQLEIQEASFKGSKTKKTLRIWVWSTLTEDKMWTLHLEGRILDATGRSSAETSSSSQTPKFTQLLKKVVIEYSTQECSEVSATNGISLNNCSVESEASQINQSNVTPSYNSKVEVAEWSKTNTTVPSDGFSITRSFNSTKASMEQNEPSDMIVKKQSPLIKTKTVIFQDFNPAKFKLSPQLAQLLGHHTETKAVVLLLLWQYIKIHKLQDTDDKRIINCNEALSAVFGFSRITFSELSGHLLSHLSPPDPLVIEYTISTESKTQVYDIAVDVVDHSMAAKLSSIPNAAASLRELSNLDQKIIDLISMSSKVAHKILFLSDYCENPADFIQKWILSQSRDLETILCEPHIELDEILRGGWWENESIHEALAYYFLKKMDDKI